MKKLRWLKLISLATLCALLMCASVGFAASVPDTGDPNEPVCNPHSYADLGNGIIKDNITGLMWQKVTAPGTYSWEQAFDYCDNQTLGGYEDWRLPSIRELATLVDSGIPAPGPTIGITYFPDTHQNYYWSSTPLADIPNGAWDVNFTYGDIHHGYDNTSTYYVRAVRGESLNNNFVDTGDGTITDTSTGLMWQKSTGSTTYTWDQAKAYCEELTLGGKSDWRLPTRNELQSIVDYNENNPAISPVFFPSSVGANHWTSTTNAVNTNNAWGLNFYNGNAFYDYPKTGAYYVRAVRAGQCAVVCVDADSDGYGENCPAGPDCDDSDPAVHENCTAPCTLKVVPKTILKITSFINPLHGFVLIGDETTKFTRTDVPEWGSAAITPLIKMRFGRRSMLTIVLINPFTLVAGQFTVTVGACSGSVTVK